MGIEDKILRLLTQGYSPTEVIEQGFKKSTVYKVFSQLQQNPASTHKGAWYVEGIRLSKERFLPGEIITVRCRLRNNTPYDFYIANVGIKPEWMYDEWYPQELRALIKPNNSRPLTLTVPIPNDIPLGEYTYSFGVEGQFLGIGNVPQQSPYNMEWSEPAIFHVKHPNRFVKIFFSHSTQNLSLVYQIESFLDNYGYEVIIAENIQEPGVILREKFQRLIRESRFLLALLTHEGIRSKWVIDEVGYAQSINKPCLLLKERSVTMHGDLEWVEFSRDDSQEVINATVLRAINNMLQRTGGSTWIGLALIGLILLALGGESENDD